MSSACIDSEQADKALLPAGGRYSSLAACG